MSDEQFDVIIVGTGAGGGTLARHLAPSGKRILLLERGQFIPREKQNWDNRAVWLEKRYIARDIWMDGAGNTFNPDVYYCVGGATKLYGAALFRLRKEDFGRLEHCDGISPAWPISYQDLEPYYTRAERLYHAHGQRGVDPTEPPASADYPFPPLSHEPRIQQLWDGLVQVGCRPFPLPVGVMLDEQRPEQSRCIRCDTCDGYPCLVHAKADAEVIGVRPALQYPNVTLLTGREVVRLETSPSGRQVTAVVARVGQEQERYQGHLVVLSAGAANSARILLASANDRHPRGLANGSDQVGRNYMFHNVSVLLAFSIQPNPTRFQKTLAVNDFYLGAEGVDYPLGNIQMFSKSRGEMYRRELPRWIPGLGFDFAARHAVDFTLITEDLPDPDNRVTITEEGQIRLAYRRNNWEPMRQLQGRLKAILKQIARRSGLRSWPVCVVHPIPISGVGHQMGTCRFGTDPATSVLDVNCRAHEVDNLYVVDTSFFPSSAAVNPSLTVMANALRVGDHLLERLGTSAGGATLGRDQDGPSP